MPVGPPKTGGSWWRGLTECGPLEKGMANHLSILALGTPGTVWKGKMIRILKEELPRSVGARYATGDQWRNNSRKNEETHCKENVQVIANNFFQQHKRRHYIWASPDGQCWNQIDYILRIRWRGSIQSAKTRLGADRGSNSEILIAKFRLKLKKVGKTTRPFKVKLLSRVQPLWLHGL